jgi:hypothetical protein
LVYDSIFIHEHDLFVINSDDEKMIDQSTNSSIDEIKSQQIKARLEMTRFRAILARLID